MKDLLAQAGLLPSAVTVIFHGQDDYTTSLPLATVLERNMLLAYRVNNADLVARNGYPFQLAAEDKYGYKWCKWVVASSCRPTLTSRGSGNARDLAMTRRSTPAPRFPSSPENPFDIRRSGLWCAMLQKKDVQLS